MFLNPDLLDLDHFSSLDLDPLNAQPFRSLDLDLQDQQHCSSLDPDLLDPHNFSFLDPELLNPQRSGVSCLLFIKDLMQSKLFQRCRHLLYCSVLSLGGNVNTRRMSKPDMGSIFHINNQ